MAASSTRRIGRPPGPRRDPGERRDELLTACVRAIRKLGPDASMADLAAEAGVTRPILYDHFGDRAGVAAALANKCVGELGTSLQGVFDRDEPFATMLCDGIAVFCAFVDHEPALWRFFQSAAPDRSDASLGLAIGQTVADALRTALERAGADTSVAEVWAAAILGAVFLSAEIWSVTRPIPRDELVAQLTALLLGGLDATGVGRTRGPFG